MATIEPLPVRRPWYRPVLDRWPTFAAIAASAAMILDNGDGAEPLIQLFPLLPLVYLLVAKLGRPKATWPTVLIGTLLIGVLRFVEVIPPSSVLFGIALVVLVWGFLDGHSRTSGTFRLQALGMLAFGALGLVALVVEPELARYLIAAGWLFHGGWDFWHLKTGRAVVRSYAEACGVVDVLVGLGLIFVM
ncbi:hypothetical protein [Phytomonospora endophytica]|uniref:Uncharacterized protein n=1 Tax=Phytomonospora endophytica TaxID=714109 RepID=A0A841FHY6_9ACTN|nr:hypothetical protein [Phytomonospora endophytica]MBB6033192.1 hypothetical protein [Phytomonospora endophytica]GIG65419.1 hypothetical protein Pen01_17140 [Phytomonospora endophytica]